MTYRGWLTRRGKSVFELRRILSASAITLLACSTRLQEPGTPSESPSPLFGGFESYETLEHVAARLPDRAQWRVIFDAKSPARDGCPRFDEFTIDIATTDFGDPGTLRLEFINQRLEATFFTPREYSKYLDMLRKDGRVADRIPPATVVWASGPGENRLGFVGWRDERFAAQVTSWISKCS